MNIAVILSGGSGNRFGGDKPKQFYSINGKTILEYSIEAFEKNDRIDEIAIVVKKDYVGEVKRIIKTNNYKKTKRILLGGKERYHSSLSAIKAYQDDDAVLFIHDAVRPMVSQRIINDCIDAMDRFSAVNVAIPASDTIICVNGKDGTIENIPDRSSLMYGQSPQGFKRGVIRNAYEIALKDPSFKTTDDCGVIKKYLPDEPVYVVKGEPKNLKVTYVEDLLLLETLCKADSQFQSGFHSDSRFK